MLFRNKEGLLLEIVRNKFKNDNDYYKAIISFKHNDANDAKDAKDANDAKDAKDAKDSITKKLVNK